MLLPTATFWFGVIIFLQFWIPRQGVALIPSCVCIVKPWEAICFPSLEKLNQEKYSLLFTSDTPPTALPVGGCGEVLSMEYLELWYG